MTVPLRRSKAPAPPPFYENEFVDDEVRKYFRALYGRFEKRRLVLEELGRYGIKEPQVVAIIPFGDSLHEEPFIKALESVSPLPRLQRLLAGYQKLLPAAEALDEDSKQAAEALDEPPALETPALQKRIAAILARLKKLQKKAAGFKLGARHKWKIPPPGFWQMTPAEWLASDRYFARMSTWGYVGDKVVELYDLIASGVPAQRRQAGGRRFVVTFNARAADLTARVFNSGFHFLDHPLTRSRVQNYVARRRRSAARR
jgi:hypothetical protein